MRKKHTNLLLIFRSAKPLPQTSREELILVPKSKLLQLLAVCCFCSSTSAQVDEVKGHLGNGERGTLFEAKMVNLSTFHVHFRFWKATVFSLQALKGQSHLYSFTSLTNSLMLCILH